MTRTEFNVSFKIQPKPDGGFEAISEMPPMRLEGPTREDVERQVRVKMVEMLGPEVAAMLPVSFADKLQQSGQSKTAFSVKKTFKIGAGLSQDGANVATTVHTFSTGGTTPSSAGDVISSSSPSSEDQFGPIRRTGDGSPAMLMLRILIAVGVVITIILLMTRR